MLDSSAKVKYATRGSDALSSWPMKRGWKERDEFQLPYKCGLGSL